MQSGVSLNVIRGKVFWEGDALMDWGNGLQLTVPASEFVNHDNNLRVVLYYTQDYTDYDDIQLFYGDWSALLPYTVGENSYTGDFIPSNYYSTGSGTSHVTAFAFSEETLSVILQKGVVIQGHGIRLNKVTITTPTGISTIVGDNTKALPIHTLDGKRVARTLPGHLYIQNGRKYIAR